MAVQYATPEVRPRSAPHAGVRASGRADSPRLGADRKDERLANALGWFSIGLGLAEVAAPQAVARLIGVRDDEKNVKVLRAMGLREIASGVGILARDKPVRWMWGRVAGDVLDLALLGSALDTDDADRKRIAGAAAAVAGVAALDVVVAQRLSRDADRASGRAAGGGAVEMTKAITINRPVDEVYGFWRDFENLPRFMSHLESVEVTGEGRSHWKASAPAGTTVEWDAEITEDRPNELIAWRSIEGADVDNSGSVRFRPAPGGRGTEVRVQLRYAPPGGTLGRTIARLFGEEPGQQVQEDLRHFKQVMETGDIVHSDASIAKGMHPARPHSKRRDD